MMDNMRGNVRMARVYGLFTELGSIYAKDIDAVKRDNEWIKIELTEKQKKHSEMLKALDF